MAAIAAVVIAVARSGWRSMRGAGSFTGNNMVAVIALLMAEEPADRPSSAAVIYLIVGLLWTFPLAKELTRRIPSLRFRLWPLSLWQRVAIYVSNLLLNPLIGIAFLFAMLSRDRAVGWGLAVLGLLAPLVLLLEQVLKPRASIWSPLQLIPRPPGPLGGLIQSHLRELLQLLDFPFAVLTAIGGIAYCRFSAKPDPAAALVFGHLVVILMSTCAQGHVSFDAQAWDTRLRLLPVSGAQVLFAKDAAWLLVTIPLLAAFHPLACTGAALAALIVGHRTSIAAPIEQTRWNFATGRLVPQGVLQIVGLVSAGAAIHNWGLPAFIPLLCVYMGSLLLAGRAWHRSLLMA